jgi:phosphoglycerate dehydrogenase-like enzyme
MEQLPQADVVFLACPLTKETQGIMGADQFKAMKKTAHFVNISRGGLVQTSALVEALERKQIAGAGLDVTDPERLPEDHPLQKLWNDVRNNIVISPHISAQSSGGRDRQWRLFRENIRRFVAGEALLGVVDKEKGF